MNLGLYLSDVHTEGGWGGDSKVDTVRGHAQMTSAKGGGGSSKSDKN